MPRYTFTTDDGFSIEHVCRYAERPEVLTLPDGRTAHYDFAADAATQSGPRPALDTIEDQMGWSIHPNQRDEYNATARAVGVTGADAQWDERGVLHASRSGLKKLNRLKAQARRRAKDDDYKAPSDLKGLKV